MGRAISANVVALQNCERCVAAADQVIWNLALLGARTLVGARGVAAILPRWHGDAGKVEVR